MKKLSKKWLFLLASGTGLIFTTLLLAPSFTSDTTAALLIDAMARSKHNQVARTLAFTGTTSFAVFQDTTSPAPAHKLIEVATKALTGSDAEYFDFERGIELAARSNDRPMYINSTELQLYRSLWKSGNVERFKWSIQIRQGVNTLVQASAIPVNAVRERCISYSEGDATCNYVAARVSLKSVDGTVTQGNRKRVEFTVRFEPTFDAEKLAETWPGKSERRWKAFDARRIAMFVLYDDGWRIVDSNLGGLVEEIPF